MIGQRTTPSTTRQKPDAHLRTATVVVVILAGTGAVGTTATFARAPSPTPTPQTSHYVLPSRQVMREMRAVIIALYGPQPPASASERSLVRRTSRSHAG
jgi:hypothetical protein